MNKTSHSLFAINKKVIGFLMGAALCLPSPALAEGFALQDWSARGAALAGGLVARGGDASAIAYNPAAITELPGTQVMFGFEAVAPTNTIEMNGPTGFSSTRTEDLLFFVPHGYVTHKYNDSLSLGFGVFSRFGLGNEYEPNWPGRNNIYFVKLQTVTANPVIAWRFNDHFSVAAGLEITGAKVELKKKVPTMTGLPDADFSLDHEDIEYGFGFNLAAHYRFNEKWNAGLTYRSAVDIDFDGTANITSVLPGVSIKQDGTTTMSLPDQITAAVSFAPNKKLSFEAQAAYYTWSRYKNLNLHFDGSLGTVRSKKDWSDSWLFSLSAEYQALEWLTLRAGVSRETSPVPDATAEYMTPTNGRWKYAVGAGIQKGNWTLDAAYVFHDLDSADYTTSHEGVYEGKSTNVYANSIVVSAGYKF